MTRATSVQTHQSVLDGIREAHQGLVAPALETLDAAIGRCLKLGWMVAMRPDSGNGLAFSSAFIATIPTFNSRLLAAGAEPQRLLSQADASILVQSPRTGHVAAWHVATRAPIGDEAFLWNLDQALRERPTDSNYAFTRFADFEVADQLDEPRSDRRLVHARRTGIYTLNPVGKEAERFLTNVADVAENYLSAVFKRATGKELNQLPCQRLREAIVAERGGQLRSRLSFFRSTLDQKVRQTTFLANTHTLTSHNHFNARGDETLRMRRRQAVEAYPVLSGPMRENADLVAAIDKGESLTPAIMKAYGASRPVLRALQGKSFRDVGKETQGAIRDLLKTLSHLDPNHLPGRGTRAPELAQWDAFVKTVGSYSPYSETRLGLLEGFFLKRAAPTWLEGESTDLSKLGDMADALEAFHSAVILPAIIDARRESAKNDDGEFDALSGNRSLVGEALEKGVLRDLSLSRLTQVSDRWHRDRDRIKSALAPYQGDTQEVQGSPLTAPRAYRTGNERFNIVPLYTRAQLQDESARMDHCVEDYAWQIAYGTSYIVSVRDEGGQSRSTAEIRLSIDPLVERKQAFEVVQHKGYHNADPPPAAQAALDTFLYDLRTGKAPCDIRGLQRAAEDRWANRRDDEIASRVGYDPDRRDGRQVAFEAYGFMLPKNERQMKVSDWLDATGITALIARHSDRRVAEPVGPLSAWDRLERAR